MSIDEEDFYKGNNLHRIELKCDRIFKTINEAKESAIKNLDLLYKLQQEEIEKYFSQFSVNKA